MTHLRRRVWAVGILALLGILVWHVAVFAQKTIHVKGYTKKDGTVVKPHDRKAPSSATSSHPTPPAPAAAVADVVISTAESAAQRQQQPPAAGSVSDMVYIVTGSKATALYHRKECPWLKDASMQVFMLHEAKSRYFQPHCLCTTGKEGTPPCEVGAPAAAAPPVVQSVTSPPSPAPVSAVSPRATPAPIERAATRQQCAATTKKGTRCSRMAQPGRAYCWQHP